MQFEFEQWALTSQDLLEEKTHFLIESFLVEQAITMFYGQEKQGKSWLLYAITKYLCEHDRINKVFYVDQDNPKRQLKARNIDALIDRYEKLRYLARGSTPLAGLDLISEISRGAVGSRYQGVVFIFDSTRDFVDRTDSDRQAKQFMESMKRLREAGGTVLLIHHATKSGKVIDGSAEFTKSADNVYEVLQRGKEGRLIQFDLPVYRDRDAIKEMMVSVDTTTLDLIIEDDTFVGIEPQREGFVQEVVDVLAQHPEGLAQSALLEACGYRRDDKTKRKLLQEYTGRFWEEKMIRNKKIYQPIKEESR